ALVANEVALGLGVDAGPQPVDDVLVRVQMNTTTGTAIGANAVGLLQIPNALLVQEILAAQRPHGAEIDDVARQLVLQRHAGKDVNLRVVAALGDAEFRLAADFAREADAAGTHDAAVGEQRDFRTDFRLIGRSVLGVYHP